MARQSKLDRCWKCDHEARLGVYIAYYSVQSNRKSGVSKQIKGSFPARGHCIDCFLELAQKKGMSDMKSQALREKLEGRSVSASGRRKL
jgi:hypothetical protein